MHIGINRIEYVVRTGNNRVPYAHRNKPPLTPEL